MKIFMILTALIASIQSEDHGMNKNPISQFRKQCKTGCQKYFKISHNQESIIVPAQKETEVYVKTCKPRVKINYMFRKKYAVLITKHFGNRPIYTKNAHIKLDKEEAEQWVKRGQCKIGTLCKPDGDCWGSTSETCKDDTTKNWVNEREFQYEGVTWDASFRDTCTMDWSCSIKTIEQNIILTTNGDPTILVGDKKIQLDESSPQQFLFEQGANIFINERLNCRQSSIKALCFRDSKSYFCEHKIGGMASEYITIGATEKCVSWGHKLFCIGENRQNADEEVIEVPIMSDLKEVSGAIRTIDKIINKNFFVLKNEMNEVKRTLTDLIINVAKVHPTIIGSIIGQNAYARYLGNMIVELCPCKEQIQCQVREEHDENTKFCPPKNSSVRGEISFFREKDNIVKINDANFDFVGKDVNVILDHLEQEFDHDQESIVDGQQTVAEEIQNYFSPWHKILEYSGMIALILSIINLLRKK